MTDKKSLAENNQSERGINRREVLLAMGAAATAAYAGSATAAMEGHNHSTHKPQHEDVLNATNDCTDKGQRCIAHCLVSFVEGEMREQGARNAGHLWRFFLPGSGKFHVFERIRKSLCNGV